MRSSCPSHGAAVLRPPAPPPELHTRHYRQAVLSANTPRFYTPSRVSYASASSDLANSSAPVRCSLSPSSSTSRFPSLRSPSPPPACLLRPATRLFASLCRPPLPLFSSAPVYSPTRRAFSSLAGAASASSSEPSAMPPAMSTARAAGAPVSITADCAKRLKDISAKEGKPVLLRVAVEAKGCKGYNYEFSFADKVEADDSVFERDGAKVVVDAASLPFLQDCVVDFQTAMIRSAFRVQKNDAADSSCSCGSSFSPKNL